MADARKDRRTLLSLKIRYKSATLEDFIERYSMDISRGGVFIKAKKPLAVGTLLKFEFMLQDQSTLIHGVGRVVWRRDPEEADSANPPGMGIKFIKMDPDSRSVVQRIVEQSGLPGVFEQGKDGVPSEPAPGNTEADSTKVRHVSEFLASALDEGGAGEAARREAQAGAERARQMSSPVGAARGAFSARNDANVGQRRSISDAPGRGAMSAFGGSSVSAVGGMRSSAAPAMDELDDDDFMDNETTKVQQLPTSEFPDADATVIAADAMPLEATPPRTPVVPAAEETPASPLETAVPDLFGPDSFGPAPGEVIDASLLDPGVATVPPKASALPKGALPDSGAIPSEAFRVPQAPAPVAVDPPVGETKKSRAGQLFLLMLVVLVGAGVAAWQLGLTDELVKTAAPYLGMEGRAPSVELAATPAPTTPAPTPVEPAAGAVADEAAEAPEEPGAEAAAEAEAVPAPAEAADPAMVKLQVVSVPRGAFVSVNGKGVGRAPLELEYTPGTKLSFFSKARGFLARRQQVVVDASQPKVKLVLSPLPYIVEVITDPPGASASAVGGGQVTTPGQLKFRSMPASRKLVISKDGYVSVTKSMSRSGFVEEKTRMLASIKVTLAKDGASAPAASEPTSAAETSVAAEPVAAEPTPPEPEAPAEEAKAPARAEPVPSEPVADGDAP
jgi:uncharacterized protein (TIGR02266 family)